MSAEIQVFCVKAIGRRLLTVDQCDVIIARTREGVSLPEIFASFAADGHEVDQAALVELAGTVRQSIEEGMSGPSPRQKQKGAADVPPPRRTVRVSRSGRAISRRTVPVEPVVADTKPAPAPPQAPPSVPQPETPRPLKPVAPSKSPTPAAAAKVPAPSTTARQASEQPARQKSRSSWFRKTKSKEQAASPSLQPERAPGTDAPVAEAKKPSATGRGLKAVVPLEDLDRNAPTPVSAEDGTIFEPPPAAKEPDKKVALLDLSKEHPDYPFWSYEALYDEVCEAFLHLLDSETVAGELASRKGLHIAAPAVEALRREAAAQAALRDDLDLRRKWSWRHKKATTNNLVREYMFLVQSKSFRSAKSELGAEIESLLEQVAPDRLLLAVHDALGRSDIEWHAILELVAYHQAGLRLRSMAELKAAAEGVRVDAFLMRVGKAVSQHVRKAGNGSASSSDKALDCVAWWLGQNREDITSDDLDYLNSLVASSLVFR